ncbi:Protocadherin-10 [Galemys pyrenaicus]|uniref:Protocadherin-10 n=1 Tax=Galemys pyrenaicus TaxID=202257 RepID=A0A8J6DLS4_GALPY|nr:Protocadherin-10 [Galemys pyrenaicus]
MIVLFLFALLWMVEGVFSQLRYTVQEEQEHGTFVGNIAEDLGLDITKLSARRFQTVPNSRTPYLDLNLETGVLYVNEKIDREQICKQSPSCVLHLEVFLENPLELFRVEIEVLDINDNPPAFPEPDLTVEISESATPGTRFPLESAFDPDVGTNSLRDYEITPNSYFSLDVQTQGDGNRFAELVLEKPLDREQQAVHRYVLTAVDGGGGGGGGEGAGGGLPPQQQRTGTALLTIRVLDSNDNVPAFDQPVYTVSLPENSPPGTLVIQLNATDPDEGQNGEVVYSFSSHISPRARELFGLAPRTGRLEVSGELDYEESPVYQVYVQAKDLGPNAVPAHCKVLVRVLDANDNAPEITFSTVKEAVSEGAAPGTVVALFSVTDRDSEENGQVQCELLGDAPFRLKSSFKNYYTIVTEAPLDREAGDSYTLTVVARDRGEPALATSKSIQVRVSDVNDNAPRFSQPVYDVYVTENNVPGAYIYAVSASDRDEGANAQLAYSILECQIQGMSVFTYVSINSENGYLYALRSFDYEQLKDFSFQVEARDAGSPQALAGNATVNILIVDQNDNAPALVAPLPGRNGTPAREVLPRSAEPGYLLTRVAAVDADDGENARLTYSIVRGNDMNLFRMDWRTGELRTARRVPAKRDPQRPYELVIEVRDHGQPPLSSTATLVVRLVDGAVEPQGGGAGGGGGPGEHQRPSRAGGGETSLDLTLILIIALGSVSFIFLLAMIVLAVRCQKEKKLNIYSCLAADCCLCCCCGAGGSACCGRQARARKKKLSKSDIMLVQSSNAPSNPAQVPVEEAGGFGSHHHSQNYCYQVCLTPESAKTDLMFLKPCSPSRSADAEHSPCGAIVAGYADQQPDIISNGGILSTETKHQRAELSYLVDRPRRVNSSAFQEADIVSSKDSGHGDSEQGDSDHDATNRGQSAGECPGPLLLVLVWRGRCFQATFCGFIAAALQRPVRRAGPEPTSGSRVSPAGMDLFSNCTEECKALGHSDRCWMPSFVPADGRQAADYRSNLHVPGMDSVPDTEVFEAPEAQPGAERSFSTFGKEKALHSTLERKELDGLLSNTRAPYKPPYLSKYHPEAALKCSHGGKRARAPFLGQLGGTWGSETRMRSLSAASCASPGAVPPGAGPMLARAGGGRRHDLAVRLQAVSSPLSIPLDILPLT